MRAKGVRRNQRSLFPPAQQLQPANLWPPSLFRKGPKPAWPRSNRPSGPLNSNQPRDSSNTRSSSSSLKHGRTTPLPSNTVAKKSIMKRRKVGLGVTTSSQNSSSRGITISEVTWLEDSSSSHTTLRDTPQVTRLLQHNIRLSRPLNTGITNHSTKLDTSQGTSSSKHSSHITPRLLQITNTNSISSLLLRSRSLSGTSAVGAPFNSRSSSRSSPNSTSSIQTSLRSNSRPGSGASCKGSLPFFLVLLFFVF